ncbi:DUF4254 domain-containing protein [Nocardia vinacea]|uniref:DUF4254 domain-containing protein n=1 Tax=Nocardia vinacea TaxID=96468 RepID=A0ABZ1Z683_9NOCA|nr:DUF4254 domain-containing protein [Nocardia vinacea]
MRTPLPSKDMILQACAGTLAIEHPVLRAAYELASLHEASLDRTADVGTIDGERARLMCRIDNWVTAAAPPAFDAAYRHTETVGMVIDRLAEFSVDVCVASEPNIPAPQLRYAQHRLTELALAYSDLCFELAAGIRRLPDFSFLAAEGDSAEPPDWRGEL